MLQGQEPSICPKDSAAKAACESPCMFTKATGPLLKASYVLSNFLLTACQITLPMPGPPATHPASPAAPKSSAKWRSEKLRVRPPGLLKVREELVGTADPGLVGESVGHDCQPGEREGLRRAGIKL